MQSETNTTVLVASKYLGSRHVRDRETKAVYTAHTQTCVARWEITGNLGINPHNYSHFVLGTGVRTPLEENTASSARGDWKTGYLCIQE